MGNLARISSLTLGCLALLTASATAQKYGFADTPGGGKDDPIIEISASIGPNVGGVVSLSPDEANALYQFDGTAAALVNSSPPPLIPRDAQGANHFIRMRFPMNLTKSIVKTIAKNSAALEPTSYLTSRLTITGDNGAPVQGIVVVNGKAIGGTLNNQDVSGLPGFPLWLNPKGKNLLVGKKILAFIADEGDRDLSTISAFGPSGGDAEVSVLNDIRIRLTEIGGVEVNGFWVLKLDDGMGQLDVGSQPALMVDVVEPLDPVTPEKFVGPNQVQVIEVGSNFMMRFSEPVIPLSVGFSAEFVKDFNAQGPTIPLFFNGNTQVVPNPDLTQLGIPIFPTLDVIGSPANSAGSFKLPYSVRARNPNNLAEYIIQPLLEIPGKVDITLLPKPISANANPTAVGGTVSSAPTSLYNIAYDDTASTGTTFRTNSTRGFVNVPVSPSVVYYAPVSGSGVGLINLDGDGYETNDPATSRILFMSNLAAIASCASWPLQAFPIVGPTALGCNPNTFGDPTGANPIGIGGNPEGHLGGPTPVPGVNEGSTGTTANAGVGGSSSVFAIYSEGFETVAKDSEGNPRLIRSPGIGSVGDIAVGDFLDKLYFDTQNVFLHNGVAQRETITGAQVGSNNISDPPIPNPPPMRFPVGLPPIDIVFNQQKLLKPALLIGTDEVWPHPQALPFVGMTGADGNTHVSLFPSAVSPYIGDSIHPVLAKRANRGVPYNGPAWQTHANSILFTSRQQIGNFLYVTDRDEGVVHVLNSNNFTTIQKISTPDPEGLSVAPDLRRVYVSNFGDDSLSVIDSNPFSPSFNKEINRTKVGTGPLAVSCQPDGEDVLVANFVGNSVSIFDPKTQTIRKSLDAGLSKPFDVLATARNTLSGFGAGVYFAYIGNQGNGTIGIYESGPSDIGLDAIRWAVDFVTPFAQMRGMGFDHGSPLPQAPIPGGIFLAHRDAQTGLPMVSRITNTEQKPQAGVLPPIPPPGTVLATPGFLKRTFAVIGSWGGPLQPLQQLNFNGQDLTPTDVVTADINATGYHSLDSPNLETNFGAFGAVPAAFAGSINSKHPYRISQGAVFATLNPDRGYVSFAGDNRVEVFDPNAPGVIVNRIQGVPLPGKLTTYFDF
jgi:hypothetical protein